MLDNIKALIDKIRNAPTSTIIVNGRSYVGRNVSMVNGDVYIDGKLMETPVERDILIQITGDIEKLELDRGSIEVTGSVVNLLSKAGNVEVGGDVKGEATVRQGNLECNDIFSTVSVDMGNVDAKTIHGSVHVKMGNISR